MVAFIRGESTFCGPVQIYVKILPDSEPVQLTHDNLAKMSPVFSPDGARIAYTTVNSDFQWDTWTVPVLGGEPQMMLKTHLGLVWTGPRQIMFSEMRMGVHMAVVAAEESRIGQRDVYVPRTNPIWRTAPLSPDGKWVLLVEMDIDHSVGALPCGSRRRRFLGTQGGSAGRRLYIRRMVAGWEVDVLHVERVGANHIWRQRFPDGNPEQITAGPTEEEGIAMAPDGRSFVTAVSLQGTSLWLHEPGGDRQISVEGNVALRPSPRWQQAPLPRRQGAAQRIRLLPGPCRSESGRPEVGALRTPCARFWGPQLRPFARRPAGSDGSTGQNRPGAPLGSAAGS
jgi:hypothetical protein